MTATVPTSPAEPPVSLLSSPMELAGDWGAMIPEAAKKVLDRMRTACLDGVRLVSDRQPTRLRVDEHSSGPPAVWLHTDPETTAWVIVDAGQRAWCQLASQFGHELGHVLANSWRRDAASGGAAQWLEESLVEALSLFGLGRLAQTWASAPPFPGDGAYSAAVVDYRRDIEVNYRRLAADQGGITDMPGWFARHRKEVEAGGGLNAFARAASLAWLGQYEQAPSCLEALGALNRWPERATISMSDYLRRWQASCHELGASPALPNFIGSRLGLA